MPRISGEVPGLFSGPVWACVALIAFGGVASAIRVFRDFDAASRSKKYETYQKLKVIKNCIAVCSKLGHDPSRFRSVSELLHLAQENKVLNEDSYLEKTYELDAWGHPFRWLVYEGETGWCIRICSDGANGIPEDGLGDDISIVVPKP